MKIVKRMQIFFRIYIAMDIEMQMEILLKGDHNSYYLLLNSGNRGDCLYDDKYLLFNRIKCSHCKHCRKSAIGLV